jgi:CRISPR/Cas system-associated exonuclease Cas4 (RecB family)
MAVARLVVAPDAATRHEAARAWLAALPADAETLVLAPSWEACDDLGREVALASGARFGTTRLTLDRLAARLAVRALAARGVAPAPGLSIAAVVARVVHALARADGLGRFRDVAGHPGLPGAIGRTLDELRLAGADADALRELGPTGADLAAVAEVVERELAAEGIADRASVLETARAIVDGAEPQPPVGVPLLLLDLPLATARDEGLVASLVRRAPSVLATVAAGDLRARAALERALGCRAESGSAPATAGSLGRLQRHLFEDSAPEEAPLDDRVRLAAWPGEARECVEIARAIQVEAARGVPFDRMAVALHATGDYASHLEEAFARAEIPCFFARGTARPNASGRALLALLACAGDGLSARGFAEYLSLGQVPDRDDARRTEPAWAPPEHDLVPVEEVAPAEVVREPELVDDPGAVPAVAGTLHAPRRWEELIVEASVIGGVDRWERRLAGLDAELARKRTALADDDELRAAALERQQHDLEHLSRFALPLVARLAALPAAATWGEWLGHLRALAQAALREPDAVLATLNELAPMATVGPLDLDEVRIVLGPRLRDLTTPPPRRRYGAVLVAPTHAMRGLVFDVVLVPGLAENLFPAKIVEDPILLDAERERLGHGLVRQDERSAAERLALRLAVGAARERVYLSYPRVDVEKARPRVPSFYALEVLRAAEGRLPGFDELGARAERAAQARLGWPAPEQPDQAIDEAEYDLALLAPLLEADPATTVGTASYLLGTNPHLARALRARARRWIRRWTPADGLVDPDALARAALARHTLEQRPFSATALQQFAACPYRFFLYAIHRLEPREEPVRLEAMDPLTRGDLVHNVQFQVLTELRDAGELPVRPATLGDARRVLDRALDVEAARQAENLAPAIPRVWEDGVDTIRADLHEWLARQADDASGWVPERFELSFAIAERDRAHADPASVEQPVEVLGGLKLRGAIDLVERRTTDRRLRVTDHKSGKVSAVEGVVVGGGEVLQPVLYALAAEALLDAPVVEGRLYYCTATGDYTERTVPLDAESRRALETVVTIVGDALREGFLPAAPAAGKCAWCDYRAVCGPYEEIRVERKPRERLEPLERLRRLP